MVKYLCVGLLVAVTVSPRLGLATHADDVAAVIRNARGSFRPVTADDVASARQDVVQRMQALGRVFDAAGANGRSWKRYLLWDQLRHELSRQAASDPDQVRRVLERYSQDHAGIELPSVLRLRSALQRYYHRVLALHDETLPEEFERRREDLAELVESLHENGSAGTLQEIGLQLAWFDQKEQIPHVVTAVRRLASNANIHLRVSQEFVTEVTREPIDRVDPLTDNILGTTVHGTSHLVGTIAAVPVASREMSRWEARLQGDASSQGRGYHGPVRAHVVGHAAVRAQTDILFGPEGFRVGTTHAQVSATGAPTALWTTCRKGLASALVTCVARRRAAKTQELGNCIASRHAEQRLEQQLNEELQARLEPLQEEYLARFRNPLLRHDAFPRVFQASSSPDGSQFDMLLATPTQMGAPSAVALAADDQAAWVLSVHASAVNNLASRMLTGRTVSELQIREFVHQLFGDAGPSEPESQGAMLHVVFAHERPLTVHVDDSVVRVHLRARNFVVGRRKYAPMNVVVQYRLLLTSDGVLATQDGEPDIYPPDFEQTGPRRLGSREIAARRLIATMLEREFDESYRLGSFQLPSPADTYGSMAVSSLHADTGWLVIAARRAGER